MIIPADIWVIVQLPDCHYSCHRIKDKKTFNAKNRLKSLLYNTQFKKTKIMTAVYLKHGSC